MSELKTLGIREFERIETEADLAAEELRTIGYAVVESGLSSDQLEAAREKIDGIYTTQVNEIGGEDRLRQMNDSDVARCLLVYDEFFLDLATNPAILTVVEGLLGEYFIIMLQNGIINRPGSEDVPVPWHRDLNYQHFISSRPLSISALYAIDDFSAETGGTHVLPATHKVERFPSDGYVSGHEQVVTIPAGSILLFDSMLFHRSGLNRSGRLRRAVNHMYTLPLIKQQISFPRALQGKFGDDQQVRRLLGYDSETGEGVQQWREGKLGLVHARA